MNPVLAAGTKIVFLALFSYTAFIILEQRKQLITKKVLFFLTLGLILDITATMLMIAGSSSSLFTLHGFIGYSALAVMFAETILIWRFYIVKPEQTKVTKILHQYSRYAYMWWVIAFITGVILVAIK